MLVLIDNYDSFTYNLYQYFGDLSMATTVIRNDAQTVDEIFSIKPKGIVISPGPGRPENSGICIDLIHTCIANETPLLGVCLGHQAIGQALGGNIIQIEPKHGKTDDITHEGTALFKNLKNPLKVTRYHSLVIEQQSLPNELNVTAKSQDGTIMAIQHKNKPIYGVQFHPESIATEGGHTLLKNFCTTL